MLFNRTMIVFFLPNGIGDTLMAIPALRRLVKVRGVTNVAVVVSNRLHTHLLRCFIDPGLRTIERYDGRRFPHFRLWALLWTLGAEAICAPMLSRKPLHVAFFASLFQRVHVPSSFISESLLLLRPSKLALEHFDGHQVNFFVQFLAELEPNIDRSLVEVAELKAISHHRSNCASYTRAVARIVVGISCGEIERHKIPGPSFFASLLNSVARHQSIQLLLIGSSSDRSLIDELCCLLSPGIPIELVIDLPIEVLIQRICECDLGISGTTGQGHMMAAAGLPMLVLAGVTNPYESGPYVKRAAVVRHRYACGPCYQETYRIGCGRVACMETLDVEEAARLAEQLLNDTDFGSGWLYKSPKLTTVSITKIRALHTRPPAEWVLSEDNQ